MDAKKRKELAAAANRLSAGLTVTAQEPPQGTLQHLQAALTKHELLKVRIATDDRDECRRVAELLAQGAGCELVQVVGRVATFYRPRAE